MSTQTPPPPVSASRWGISRLLPGGDADPGQAALTVWRVITSAAETRRRQAASVQAALRSGSGDAVERLVAGFAAAVTGHVERSAYGPWPRTSPQAPTSASVAVSSVRCC